VSYTVTGPATVSGSTLIITGAGTVSVTANQAGHATYAPASAVTQTVTAAKAALTITAANANIAYGQAIPAFTYTSAGYVNGDTSAVLSGTPAETTTATSTSPAGSYPITITQGTLAAANYTFTFANGTLTVSGSTQGQPAAPQTYPAPGIYFSAQTLIITDGTRGSSICYTTGGSTPIGLR
jgi:hypothetical protein